MSYDAPDTTSALENTTAPKSFSAVVENSTVPSSATISMVDPAAPDAEAATQA
ncbi:hypothetical protein QMO46_03735 [Microbacterium barkeri]|uniref:hypothetical protein n=1 Tax=Microbacterium barkeri TaxID=33917 RepID=UPI0024AEE260|nr:hypothetical protein [Microbacterium barkeri]MDI6942600.1 hypothetical protein [Microbacterium barkeri]